MVFSNKITCIIEREVIVIFLVHMITKYFWKQIFVLLKEWTFKNTKTSSWFWDTVFVKIHYHYKRKKKQLQCTSHNDFDTLKIIFIELKIIKVYLVKNHILKKVFSISYYCKKEIVNTILLTIENLKKVHNN